MSISGWSESVTARRTPSPGAVAFTSVSVSRSSLGPAVTSSSVSTRSEKSLALIRTPEKRDIKNELESATLIVAEGNQSHLTLQSRAADRCTMKVDKPTGPPEGIAPRSMPFTVARIVSAEHGLKRLESPALARIVQADPGRYVIELADERLTIETQLPLKLRQMVELRPVRSERIDEYPRVEIRPGPVGAVAIFAERPTAFPSSREALRAESGSRQRGRSTPQPEPVAPIGRAKSTLNTSPTPDAGRTTSAPPLLPLPRRTDLINLRELSSAVAKPRPLRLPILRIESPDLHSGEDTVLRVIESAGQLAVAELKGIVVAIDSPRPLKAGQELLCRVLQVQPSLRLEALSIVSNEAEGSPPRLASPRPMEVPSPFTIEVRGRRLPAFPPEVEVAARICEADPREAQLTLGPIRVRVRNALGWRSGDRLHARVVRTAASPAIEVSPDELQQQPDVEIRAGTKLTATVQRRIGPERFLIRIGSRSFEAATRTPLTPDSTLSVQVDRAGRQPRLLILEQTPSIEAVARQLLTKFLPTLPPLDAAFKDLSRSLRALAGRPTEDLPAKLRPLVVRLQRFLESAAPGSMHKVPLQELVGRSGLGFEKRLAESVNDPRLFGQVARDDLKGMLLKMAAIEPASESPRSLADLRQSAEQVLGHLEVQQATNLLKSVRGDGIRLLIPFSLGSHFTTAQVEIRRRRDSGGRAASGPTKGRTTTLLFLLDLEGLGKTQIEARVGGEGLQADFFIEEEEAVPILRRGLPDLARKLAKKGYPSIRLEAYPLDVSDPCPIDEPADMITSEEEEEAVRLINFQA